MMKIWNDAGRGLGAVLLIGMMAFAVETGGAETADAAELIAAKDLEGTIWFSDRPHRRVTVSIRGDVDILEGKEVYLRFTQRIDDIFVIEVRWWNEAAGLNVLEHGVLTQIAPNTYSYVDADHVETQPGADAFPGVIGRGTFEILSEDTAKFVQVGHLIDGSASGFTTVLKKVDGLPEAPLEQTFPPRAD